MRLLGLLLFILLLPPAGASLATYKTLSCSMEVADPEDVEYSITRTAHGFGDQQPDGSWKFFLELSNIHAFYFRPIRTGSKASLSL